MLLDLLQRITGSIRVSRFVCLEFFLVCLAYLKFEGIVLVYTSNSILDLIVTQCFPETFLIYIKKKINPLSTQVDSLFYNLIFNLIRFF